MVRKSEISRVLISIFFGLVLWSCQSSQDQLPVLGPKIKKGETITDHTIAPFRFMDQDSTEITQFSFSEAIYVADFFFTTCRTICPIMKTNMLQVYEATKGMKEVKFLSHTIDPEYDNVPRLRDYARKLGVDSERWHFVTGSKDSIYTLAENSYFVSAKETDEGPDSYIHSGAFLLIDKKGRLRGKYDGTKEAEVHQLILDIKKLRTEKD